MKIAIATDTYYPHVNGASYSTQRFAQALAAAGHEVSVIAPSETLFSTKKIRNGVIVYGIPSFPTFINNGFRFTIQPSAATPVTRAMREIGPEILHMQMHFAISYLAMRYARKNRIPVVATNHFMPDNLVHYLPFPKMIQDRMIAIAWRDAARVYDKTDLVISPTVTAKRILDRWLKKESIVISNGVDLEHFHNHHDTAHVKTLYRLPQKPLLLYVGRLDAEKNVSDIIRAMAKTKDAFHFVVAGIGAERAHIESLAATLGVQNRVTFTGFVSDDDLPALYAAVDCFINAGTAELQGMSVMEAMSSSLPIVAARAVALPELVVDEVNGHLFEPGDCDSLAKILDDLFAHTEKRVAMGAQSRAIIEGHSFSTMVSKCEAVYRTILAKDAASSSKT